MNASETRNLIAALERLAKQTSALADRFATFDVSGLNSLGVPTQGEELMADVLTPLCRLLGMETVLNATNLVAALDRQSHIRITAKVNTYCARLGAQLVEASKTAALLHRIKVSATIKEADRQRQRAARASQNLTRLVVKDANRNSRRLGKFRERQT